MLNETDDKEVLRCPRYGDELRYIFTCLALEGEKSTVLLIGKSVEGLSWRVGSVNSIWVTRHIPSRFNGKL